VLFVRAASLLIDAAAHLGLWRKWADTPRNPEKFPRLQFGFGQLIFSSSSSDITVMGCWDGCCWWAVVNKRPQRVELAGWLIVGHSLLGCSPVCCSWQASKKKKNIVSVLLLCGDVVMKQQICYLLTG
jgi:hypothetical protein